MKKLLLTLSFFCFALSSILAQDSQIKLKVKDGSNPDIYIDGKKYDHDILEIIDQNKIARMDVIKGKKALDEYKAPNGVILIVTKKADKNTQVKVRMSDDLKGVTNNGLEPMIIIDGKKSNKDQLSDISPDDIASINVIKGEQAISKYKSPNGVIIVKTKSAKN